ncbi:site-specific integrase [Clostridia bacterium]|nr:site-specific integrase [Clostridia bacterium]
MPKPFRRADGRYTVKLELAPDPITGKRRRKYIYGDTRQECVRKASEFEEELRNNTVSSDGDMSLSKYLPLWFDINCAQLSPTTKHMYENSIKTHLIPALGNLKVKEVIQIHIQQFVNELSKEYRDKTCRNIKGILHKAFNDAIQNGYIKYNPCIGVKVRRSEPYKYYIYNEAEFAALMTAAAGTPEEIPILLAASCGLREGEIMGLKWENIDFDQGVINITQNAVNVNGMVIVKEPKTYTSTRRIKVPAVILDKLRTCNKTSNYVYSKGKANEPENGRNFGKRFDKILRDNNLPHTRFHDLRHPYVKHTLKNILLIFCERRTDTHHSE